jgi:oligopeptide/dipeptide ABC transporter ATP-binding protein
MSGPSRSSQPLLSVRGLSKRFPVEGSNGTRAASWLSAVDFVDLDVHRGETVGLVGESGSGKTTLARLILRLLPASAGSVRFDDLDVLAASETELREFRRRAQLVFQDPYASLNPDLPVGELVGEGLSGNGHSARECHARLVELLELVELPAAALGRYPDELSGGERQRVSIARALAVQPELLILDEPVSALDGPVQNRVLNLLADLRGQLGLSYLLISHDIGIVRHLADHVAVMYLARIVETGPAASVLQGPLHPYTQALLTSLPTLHRSLAHPPIRLAGEPPSPVDLPRGCRFASRCRHRIQACVHETPALVSASSTSRQLLACFNPAPLGTFEAVGAEGPAELDLRPPPALRQGRRHVWWPSPALAGRIGRLVVLLAISSVIVFAGLSATPTRTALSPAQAERLGLDKPVAAQWVLYARNLLSGDPGNSLVSGAPIGSIVKTSGANTLKLSLAALVLVYALAIPLGIAAAWRRDRPADQLIRVFAIVASGIPNFFLALLLVQLFAVDLGWLPVAGPGGFAHLVLPATVLALESLAINVRLMRSSILDQTGREYVRTLRAKGLPDRRVIWIHALRNALPPVVALAALTVPLVLGYTLVVEVIFRYEGLGYQLVQAILNRDYILGTTLALLLMTVVLLCSRLADAAQRRLDPRTRPAAAS